tara:strand:- start:197 stop:604 length:408 start_codon:yes stop_codon:yes gene_type:complete
MAKVKKSILTADWLDIKEMYEKNTNGTDEYGKNFPVRGEFHDLTMDFLDKVAKLTEKLGFECTVEGVHMNLWKERIWSVIENGGLLQPIAWKGDLAKDEAIAAKQKAEDDFYHNEFGDMEDYEPSDEELMATEKY